MSTPTERVLAWAARQIALDAKVIATEGLHCGSNPWLLRIEHGGGTTEAVLRVADDRRWPAALANETTALRLAAAYDLAAPRLIAADLDGSGSGVTALLQTVLPGNSRNPHEASDERLRAFGAAGAALHAISRPPDFELRVRTHPIPPDDYAPGAPVGGALPRRVRRAGEGGGASRAARNARLASGGDPRGTAEHRHYAVAVGGRRAAARVARPRGRAGSRPRRPLARQHDVDRR